jgi:hypothetical protein
MRRIFALAMVALLAVTMAFAVIGCGQKHEESTPAESTTPPAESSMPDTGMGGMSSDTSMADTSMSH